jgi:hypothetical protein
MSTRGIITSRAIAAELEDRVDHLFFVELDLARYAASTSVQSSSRSNGIEPVLPVGTVISPACVTG